MAGFSVSTGTPDADTAVLYAAGWQATKVRLLTLVALACAAGALWWGLDLAQHYGLAPGDGGVLKPWPARVALGGGVAALGLAFLAGMWVYGRHYVVDVRATPDSERLCVRTLWLFGATASEIDRRAWGWGAYHEGAYQQYRSDPLPGIAGRSPWLSIRLPGWRWPLILDAQGHLRGDDGSWFVPAASPDRLASDQVRRPRQPAQE